MESDPKSIDSMSYTELTKRKESVNKRLSEIILPTFSQNSKDRKKNANSGTKDSSFSNKDKTSNSKKVKEEHQVYKIPSKTDVHWDFLMKEMMWLAADFQSERKRQISSGKKLAGAVKQFHNTKEVRRLRELAEAEAKRRRLAAKLARDVKTWWTKIEKIISFKQKLQLDQLRQKQMDKHLVYLVKQTERYSQKLNEQLFNSHSDQNSKPSIPSPSKNTRSKRINRYKLHSTQTIEHALSVSPSPSNSKSKGEKSDSPKKSFTVSNDVAARTLEYDTRQANDDMTSSATRYRTRKTRISSSRRVTFAPNLADEVDNDDKFNTKSNFINIKELFLDNNNDVADGDADISDDSLDFENDENDLVDDETTIEAEEKLGREMSVEEELELLKKEAELSVDEVWANIAPHTSRDKENKDDAIENDSSTHSSRKTSDALLIPTKPISDLEPKPISDDDMNNINYLKNVTKSDDIVQNNSDKTIHKVIEENNHDENNILSTQSSKTNTTKSKDTPDTIIHTNGNRERNSKRKRKSKLPSNSSYSKLSDVIFKSTGYDTAEDDEYVEDATNTNIDDETTIEIEERLGREISHEEEIAMLKQESEIPMEELKELYVKMQQQETKLDSDNSIDESNSEMDITTDTSKQTNMKKNTSSLSSLFLDNNSDEEEFHPGAQPDLDDETTLDAEEKLGGHMNPQEEIEMLKQQGGIPIEDLLAMHAKMENELNRDNYVNDEISVSSSSDLSKVDLKDFDHGLLNADEDGTEEEFEPPLESTIDDETTIEAEEKLGREMSHEEEISYLKRESEIPIEELQAMYLNMSDNADNVSTESNMSAQSDSVTNMKSYDVNNDNASNTKKRSCENTSDSYTLTKKSKLPEINGKEFSALRLLQSSDEQIRQTTVSRPYLLSSWVNLRKYQQIGLNWLVSIQSRRLNGILADEMGLGKTLQTISLLSYLASYKGIWGPHLIIVPTSCIVNWEVELKRFCPSFKVLCYHGSAKRRKELRQGWTKTNWYHVVITSYQLAVQDAFAFKRKRWYYFILDEAQNIKNFQSQRWQTLITFNTQRRLLLTGTPLQNNLMELWSLLHFLMPHIFKSRKEFSYWFSNPMSHIIEGNANRNDDLISRLHGIIRPFVLRRLKKDVETQMPPKYEHIVKCELSRRQMFLYEEFISRSSTRVALKKGGNFMGMMNVLMQLRKVCNHPDLFEPRSVITPFTMEPVSLTTAGCVINAIKPKSSLNQLSKHLLYPLWTVSNGIPSFDHSIVHDNIRSEQLSRLKTPLNTMLKSLDDQCMNEPKPNEFTKPELFNLLQEIWNNALNEKENVTQRNSKINSWRCQTQTFPYPDRLLEKFQIRKSALEQNEAKSDNAYTIASTPKDLLDMKKSQMQRAQEMDEVISKFVFCVPRASSSNPILDANANDSISAQYESILSSELMTPIETHFRPFCKANARLSSFFPDKKLIQFDAGKLQTLCVLLRGLKRDGHRCLIFTQMSKMLNILEAFLNLNGHTYVRLDGSTGVDARQRLMDRFNNDTKIFCFILSTRSGGLGINLTGADTVIFYDSDWNPAMDAQAQDRAHRIGQTREVHIYRLVTKHTIEENILIKAKQKRQLDFLVMDEGNFFAGGSGKNANGSSKTTIERNTGVNEKSNDVFTKEGLRDILGVNGEEDDLSVGTASQSTRMTEGINETDAEPALSKEQMESAMATLEDEDDVKAMRGAQKEAAEELKEFDESMQFQKENDGDNDSVSKGSQDDETVDDENKPVPKNKVSSKRSASSKEAKDDAEVSNNVTEMEKEFAAWQSKGEVDIDTLSSSLKATERYGILFREKLDPYFSVYYETMEEELLNEKSNSKEGEFDVDEIEETKEAEERRVMEDGDLLVTNPHPEMLLEQRKIYLQEKASLRAKKKRRRLTGENWVTKIDGNTKLPFWYNEDTGEAIWEKPAILLELQADKIALKKKWGALPLKPLLCAMKFLLPYPDRFRCARVCRQWRSAANDISFVKHVYPVEMGALGMDVTKLDTGHFRSISDAMASALPGDTIELGDGHYWIHEPGISVDHPVRLVGDEHDPSHVVLEMSGTITWKGRGGWMEGITIRRPKMASESIAGMEILSVEGDGRVDMAYCVLDNEGGDGNTAKITGSGFKGKWDDVLIKNANANNNGVRIEGKAILQLKKCEIKNNGGNGMSCIGTSVVRLSKCKIRGNNGYGICMDEKSCIQLIDSKITDNEKGSIHDGDTTRLLKDKSLSIKSVLEIIKNKKQPDEVPSTRVRTRSNAVTTSS